MPPKTTSRNMAVIAGTLAAAVAAYSIGQAILDDMAARALAIVVVAAVFWAAELLPLFATALVVVVLEILLLASDGGLAEDVTQLLHLGGLLREHSPDLAPISASAFLTPFASDIIMLFSAGFSSRPPSGSTASTSRLPAAFCGPSRDRR